MGWHTWICDRCGWRGSVYVRSIEFLWMRILEDHRRLSTQCVNLDIVQTHEAA